MRKDGANSRTLSSLYVKTRWWKAGMVQQSTDSSQTEDAREKGVEKVMGVEQVR